MKYVPSLDKNFQPLILKLRAFEEAVEKAENTEFTICLERHLGYNYIRTVKIYKDGTGHDEENYQMVERIVKSMLWVVGGYKFYFKGSKYLYEKFKADYSKDGARAFDADFMANVYENDFEVVYTEEIPAFKEEIIKLNSKVDGCRIGFDAGGSDRKVSAVVNGEVIFSNETVWNPKITEDPQYHYDGILE